MAELTERAMFKNGFSRFYKPLNNALLFELLDLILLE
jgi:hypothetical protein